MMPAGKILLLFGLIIAALGALLLLTDKFPFIGKLPGDINIKKEHFQFFMPIASSIVLSLVITLILWLISFLKK